MSISFSDIYKYLFFIFDFAKLLIVIIIN